MKILEISGALAPYIYLIALIFVGVFAWLRMYYPNVAKRLETLDQIAENIVAKQGRYDDKEGAQKFEDGLKEVMAQADKAHIKTTKANAAGALQKAYNNTQAVPTIAVEDEVKTDEPVEQTNDLNDLPDAPVEFTEHEDQ